MSAHSKTAGAIAAKEPNPEASRPAALWSSDVLSSHHERPLCAAGCIDHLAARSAVGRGFGATSMISIKLPLWLTPRRTRFTFFNG
jgi:hypothetical protein